MPITPTFSPIANWVSASYTGSVTFSSLNQDYDHLVITGGLTRSLSGDFGGRSGDFVWNSITSGYKTVQFRAANGGNALTSRGTNNSAGPNVPAGNIDNQGGRQAWEIWIPNYRSTKYQKHALVKAWTNDTAANNGGAMTIEDFLIPTTSALTTLTVSQNTDTFVPGDWLTIYGVKNA